MEKPLAIANELIILANRCGSPLTQMKLQKLIYFAHGWHLALFDRALVDESFQAWRYGPEKTMYNKDFYPTPKEIALKMIEVLPENIFKNARILEPSAGKGDLADCLTQHLYSRSKAEIHCCEIHPDLRLRFFPGGKLRGFLLARHIILRNTIFLNFKKEYIIS